MNENPDDALPRRVAAIDCGTNSLRLLIADVIRSADESIVLQDLHRSAHVVGLGRGLEESGHISDLAIDRAFDASREFRAIIDAYDVDSVHVVATSACRDASNGSDLLKRLGNVLAAGTEIATGEREAALTYMGAMSSRMVRDEPPAIVVDLGAGSTEFTFSERGVIRYASIDIGAVRLADRHRAGQHADPLSASEVSGIRDDTLRALHQLPRIPVENEHVVGVAATALTVAAFARGSTRTDLVDGDCTLPILEAIDACNAIARLSPNEAAQLTYVSAGREDIIATGAIIWGQILTSLRVFNPGIDKVTSTHHDILDGLALERASRHNLL